MEIKENKWQRNAGFTLIELMVTLVLAVILIAIAVPSFQSSTIRNSIEAQIGELHASLSLARSEAISRGAMVSICRSSNQTACNSGTTWSEGWMVFVDNITENGSWDAGEEIIRVHEQLSHSNDLTLTDAGAKNFIQFESKGLVNDDLAGAFQTGTFRLCRLGQPVTYARALNISATGRAFRSRDNNGDGIHEDNGGANLTCP